MSENIEEWFKKFYELKNKITEDIIDKIKLNAETLMTKNKKLIFLPARVNHIEIFRILYNEIKKIPGILELVDEKKNDGTLLAWLCWLNLNDLLDECFDNINKDTFNTKESSGDTPLLYMI